MARVGNGSIHEMSLLVGELKGAVQAVTRTVEHLNNNWKMKDEEATRGRERLHGEFQELKSVVHGGMSTINVKVDGVVQDVAEMKNDLSTVQGKLADYEENKRIAVAAVGDVNELKKFRVSIENKEQRALGWWDVIKGIGKVGWAIIAGLLMLAAAVLSHIIPRWL